MSLEKFVKKLKKFLDNRGAELLFVEVKMFDVNTYESIKIGYVYNYTKMFSDATYAWGATSLKLFTDAIFQDIKQNISNTQNMHKGE